MNPLRLVSLAVAIAAAVAVYLYASGPRIPDAQPMDAALLAMSPPAPTGEVLLTIDGAPKTNRDNQAVLDGAALAALPQRTIVTPSEWTDGDTTFSGPLARDVMALVGVTGGAVKAVAINDYGVEIPIEDFLRYDVLFATSMNGAPLAPEDRGPIWIVYPRKGHPELNAPSYHSRWIWQLVKISVL